VAVQDGVPANNGAHEVEVPAIGKIVQLEIIKQQKSGKGLLTIIVEGGSLSDNVRAAEWRFPARPSASRATASTSAPTAS
jgi:hypothetical protein